MVQDLPEQRKSDRASPFLPRSSVLLYTYMYVHGTSNVAKCNVLRHLSGKAHQIAITADQGKPADQRIASGDGIPESPSIKRQIKITTSMDKMALDSYRKLLNTAYELALNPSMPLSHFKVLVKCQRQNGVCLIDGKDDSHSCREYIHYIADTIREKVAVILGSAYFMSTLSDGSQARKVKDEKELVLVRTERNGIPVYFVASILEMSQYGGTDADSIKKAIDDVFVEKLFLDEDQYVYSMISSTADGASVNFGKYRGVLTQLKSARP